MICKKYKLIIFDLDGVICHTDKFHFMAWKEIADEIGVPFNENINSRLRGVSRSESLEIILELYEGEISAERKQQYTEKKNAIYRKYLESMSELDLGPEIKSTMNKIRENGMMLAIGSSSKNAPLILEKLGLKDYFDAVVDGNQISRSKPDPEVFLKASTQLDVDPGFCLVVEDAKSGLEAARAAGMDCAAIGDAVKYNTADYNLEKFSDLLTILDVSK